MSEACGTAAAAEASVATREGRQERVGGRRAGNGDGNGGRGMGGKKGAYPLSAAQAERQPHSLGEVGLWQPLPSERWSPKKIRSLYPLSDTSF